MSAKLILFNNGGIRVHLTLFVFLSLTILCVVDDKYIKRKEVAKTKQCNRKTQYGGETRRAATMSSKEAKSKTIQVNSKHTILYKIL